MTTEVRDTAIEDTLARAFAGLDGEPGDLLSVTIPAPALDPLAVFTAGAGYGVRSYVEQPAQPFSLAALGSAARIAPQGGRRFDEASAEWRRLVATTAVADSAGCPLAAPVALGGFGFAAASSGATSGAAASSGATSQAAASSGATSGAASTESMNADGDTNAWAGFPEALLTVPRLLFVTTDAGAWLIASCRPDETEALVAELAGVRSRAAAISSSADATAELMLMDGTPQDDWKRTVAAVVERIHTTDLRKLVLAREVVASAESELQPAAALHRLRSRYEGCTAFAFAYGDGACFIGATPERLVRLDGRTARVDSLAGSAPRGATEEEDAAIGAALLRDAKEREEHQLVVAALRTTLAPISSALDVPDEPRLLAMPNVQHLQTPIEATLADGQNVIDLVSLLHPTPAAGGVPQRAACDLIDAYEPFDRGWYAGPVGWTDARGDGEFVVAIRSALLRGREARFYAGCGIVAGSDPNREFEESRMKLEPMRWALGGGNS